MESLKLEDMTHVIGPKDNTIVKSVVNKVNQIKSNVYSEPKVLFEDKKDCYRVTFWWDEQVAFSYTDDIAPIVEMIEKRFHNFYFSPVEKEGEICTTLSFDIIKEAHIDIVSHLSTGKRNSKGKIKLPKVTQVESNYSTISRENIQKRRRKTNSEKIESFVT